MGVQQRSKKAREIKKQAVAAGLPCNFSHCSHIAGVARGARRYRHKKYLVMPQINRHRWKFFEAKKGEVQCL